MEYGMSPALNLIWNSQKCVMYVSVLVLKAYAEEKS